MDKKVVVAILGVGAIGRGVADALGRDGRVELRLFDPVTAKDEYDSPKTASQAGRCSSERPERVKSPVEKLMCNAKMICPFPTDLSF